MFYTGKTNKNASLSNRQSTLTWGKKRISQVSNPTKENIEPKAVDKAVHKAVEFKAAAPGWLNKSQGSFSESSTLVKLDGDDESAELEIISATSTPRMVTKVSGSLSSSQSSIQDVITGSTRTLAQRSVVSSALPGPIKRQLPWETAADAVKKQYGVAPRSSPVVQSKYSFSHSFSQPSQSYKASPPTNQPSAPTYAPTAACAATARYALRHQKPQSGSGEVASSSTNSSYSFNAGHDNSRITLNQEQIIVYEHAMRGKSIFFTGAAGTGKSVLLRSIIRGMWRKYKQSEEVAITATTGMAALNIGGRTLHSWAGVGMGTKPVGDLIRDIQKKRDCLERWQKVRVLIIDEVSMLDGTLLDKLDKIGRRVRKADKPFGGIKLILTGDFYQLPPVAKGNEKLVFAFQAKCWNEYLDGCFELKTVHRQKGDNTLIEMLTAMRKNNLTPEINRKFAELSRPVTFSDGNEATHLYSLRREVAVANQRRLDALPGRIFEFRALDGGVAPEFVRKSLLDSFREEEVLQLKIGTQVMLVENKTPSLVNGSRGRVETFVPEAAWSRIRTRMDRIPDYLELYNAVLNGLDETDHSIKVRLDRLQPKVRDELYFFARGSSDAKKTGDAGELIPVVRFPSLGLEPMPRHENKVMRVGRDGKELPEPEAFRSQIPLVLSYAMSIHKAQGQTIDRLVVDLNKIFAAGQAYVAVSRATNRENLQILNFSSSKVFVHKDVTKFYQELQELT